MTDQRYEHGLEGELLDTWRAVFVRQRAFAEHAFEQLDDADFFAAPEGLNSVAVIARHMAGNMLSRWTGFLTTDGEKPTRDRDVELAPFPRDLTPQQQSAERVRIMDQWGRGWESLLTTLDGLTDADLRQVVTIRGAPHAVHAAIARQLDHYAFHVGQINVIARLRVGSGRWRWFTLPPGGTAAFNEQMRASRPVRDWGIK